MKKKFKVGQTVLICFNTPEQIKSADILAINIAHQKLITNTSVVVADAYRSTGNVGVKFDDESYLYIPPICLH